MMDFIGKLSGFVGKNLTYIVFLVVIWAYFMPNAFLWAVPHTVLLLGVIMFGMGMTLHARDFKLIVQRPKEVLIGCTAHYTIMPLLAYALVLAFEMPPEIAVGMILLGSCPSGTASNVMGFLAKADVPLSVSITTCSTLLAPIHRLGPGRPMGRSFLYGYGHDGHESHPGSLDPRLIDASPDGRKTYCLPVEGPGPRFGFRRPGYRRRCHCHQWR